MRRLHRAFFLGISLLCLASLAVAFNPAIPDKQMNTAGQSTTPRSDADSILLAVTVTDKKGNPVGGLDKSAFAIHENKIQQEITFFSAEDMPASIGIIFDLSSSMGGDGGKKLKAVRNAVLRFIELSHSGNEYFFVAFAARPRLLIDWTRNSKIAAEEFSKYKITAMGGNTALYDACYLGIEKMVSVAHPKRAILLITDGQDNNSQYTFKNVRERLKETGVTLYSVGMFGGDDPGSSLGMEGQAAMDELSAISGGKSFFPEGEKQIDEVFDRIAAELRHQYLLGFKPSKEKADGKWHKIKLKVTPPAKPDLYVRSREGYYALKNLR